MTLGPTSREDPLGTPEQTEDSGQRTGWLSRSFLVLLLPVGGILFAFGAVGLYEDREFLSRDLALVVVGLVMIVLSIPVILRAVSQSDENNGFGIGSGFFFLIWGGIKLAVKTANGKPWWDIGLAVLMVIAGLYWIVEGLREKRAAAEVEEAVGVKTNEFPPPE